MGYLEKALKTINDSVWLRKEEVYRELKKAKLELVSKTCEWEKVFDYLNIQNPDLNRKIDEAQDRIDNHWKEGKSLEEIKEAISEWKEHNMEALRLSKQEN